MPDKEYQIKISADSATAQEGAQKAASALKDLGQQGEQAGKAHEEAGRKTRSFGGHMKELKKVAQELSADFPVAGMALRAFLNPIGFAASSGVAAFVMLKSSINSIVESMRELADVRWTAAVEARDAVLRRAAGTARELAEAIERIRNATNTPGDDASRRMRDIAAEFEHQARLRGINQERDLAGIQASEQAGRLSPVEARSAEQVIRARYARAEMEDNRNRRQREEAVQQEQIQREADEVARRQAEAQARRAEVTRMEAERASAEADQQTYRRQRETAQQNIEAADAVLNPGFWGEVGYRVRRVVFGDVERLPRESAAASREAAENQLRQAQQGEQRTSRRLEQLGQGMPSAEGAASAAESDVRGAAGRFNRAYRDFNDMRGSNRRADARDVETYNAQVDSDLARTLTQMGQLALRAAGQAANMQAQQRHAQNSQQ